MKQNHDEYTQAQKELDREQYELDQLEELYPRRYFSDAVESAFRVGKAIGRVEKLCEQVEREKA